jgi:hypothetical protein
MPNIGGVAASIIRVISDTFNRTVSGSLGSASGGTQRAWLTTAGTWSANGSSATSADAGSSYARAYQLLHPNATISADVSGGVGLSFWASTESSILWHAAHPNYIQNTSTSSSCTGGTVSCTDSSNTCSPGGCGTVSSSSSTSSSCTGGTVYCYSAGCTPSGSCGTISESVTYTCPPGYNPGTDIFGNPVCNDPFNPFNPIPATQSYTRSSASLVSSTTYTRTQNTTVTVTTYTYDTQIKVISSVSGSVVTASTTTLVSGAGSLSPVGSLKVVTSGNSATITAYSSAGLVSQLGSPITYSPGSPNTGHWVGIIKAPSTYSQGSTLDNFSATA